MANVTSAEMRLHFPTYLRAIHRDGASFVVTYHNRPVARLVPLAPTATESPSGVAYLRALGITASPLGEAVADVLAAAYGGLHHLLREVQHPRSHWDATHHLEICVQGALSTWSSGRLTCLLARCQDAGLHLEISAAATGYLRLLFHPIPMGGM